MNQILESQSLYDRDFLLWTEDTVAKLKAGDFSNLDLQNLIEEVDSLGRSQKRELLNRLTTLLEHLVKRLYVEMPENYRGWENTIREQRRQLRFTLDDAPSLRFIWEQTFDRAWQFAYKDLKKEYPLIDFPDRWAYSYDLETILNVDFWQTENL